MYRDTNPGRTENHRLGPIQSSEVDGRGRALRCPCLWTDNRVSQNRPRTRDIRRKPFFIAPSECFVDANFRQTIRVIRVIRGRFRIFGNFIPNFRESVVKNKNYLK